MVGNASPTTAPSLTENIPCGKEASACLVSRWPGVLPEETISTQPITTLDITASILAAAQIDPPRHPPLDGQDIFPVLTGKMPPQERTFFWRVVRPDQPVGQSALRRGKWKYIRDRKEELLYDLDLDPGEEKNLADQYPDMIAELRQALADWEKQFPLPP